MLCVAMFSVAMFCATTSVAPPILTPSTLTSLSLCYRRQRSGFGRARQHVRRVRSLALPRNSCVNGELRWTGGGSTVSNLQVNELHAPQRYSRGTRSSARMYIQPFCSKQVLRHPPFAVQIHRLAKDLQQFVVREPRQVERDERLSS